jgi:hypothetical protein
MRVVFLDFDGVLNSLWSLRERGSKLTDLCPWHIERLNEIVECACAEVVISSSWRISPQYSGTPVTALREELTKRGFRGHVRGVTPDLSRVTTPAGKTMVFHGVERGMEIQRWLDVHAELYEVSRFVILDDHDDMAHLKNLLVQTDLDRGLQPEHVERAVQILTAPA